MDGVVEELRANRTVERPNAADILRTLHSVYQKIMERPCSTRKAEGKTTDGEHRLREELDEIPLSGRLPGVFFPSEAHVQSVPNEKSSFEDHKTTHFVSFENSLLVGNVLVT